MSIKGGYPANQDSRFFIYSDHTARRRCLKEHVDLLLAARKVYRCDPAFRTAQAVAVKDGRIVGVGSRAELEIRYSAQRFLDLSSQYVYPGFIDPHCHFLSYGYVLQRADLFNTSSWDEVLERLAAYKAKSPAFWILGRGWNQNDWAAQEFPDRTRLDELFPGNPVLLTRIDGHAAIANAQALRLAGITADTKVEGGAVAVDQGSPTGLLLDNAIDLVRAVIPAPSREEMTDALLRAQQNCFAAGLTSVSNAGTELDEAILMHRLQAEGRMKMRIYVMLATGARETAFALGKPPDSCPLPGGIFQNESLSIRSFKMFADGALGSRGAFLLEPYADDPDNRGLLTCPEKDLERQCSIATECGYQMNVHAIGDAAARMVLDSYARFLKPGNDLRWRVEHAQLIHPDDLPKFGRYGIIPSIQTTHATSDMKWAPARLGKQRMRYAHIYRELLAQNGWLANGSDFPIEKIEPLRGFRSAVFRTNDEGEPKGGFQPENALTPEEALKAMTIWAAKANFEDHLKGSIEVGKLADFTVLPADLMEVSEERLRAIKPSMTIVGGEIVF
ncbi:MAG: amidohydrolase [Spirochaetia bacterium]|nr:amidohydrolase [Spirochaetia bacterium]